ncbi:MAG: RNA pseudouridine synthase [Bacteroidetes bacterium]|nr:MAG: RNA pseudouridine synthase [Bacteroidota bacterium]
MSHRPSPEDLFLVREVPVDPGQSPLRVDRFLVDRLENVSRAFLRRALDRGMVWVSGAPVKASYRVKPGDVVHVYQEEEPREVEVLPEDIPLDVVHEDEDLLVVNKPAGMVVHPGHGHFSGTLINALLFHFRDLPLFQEGGVRPGLAHRIDKDTSGLLAIGKTERAMQSLGQQFLAKSTSRSYLALVWGRFEAEEGTVEGHIGRDPRDRQRQRVFPDGEQGKPAVTHYRVLESYQFASLLECRLETGRMHQIRVHMQHIQHPLFGDARYGGDRVLRGVDTPQYRDFIRRAMLACPRQALHAQSLGLKHPVSGEALSFSVPPPADMQELLTMWREYVQGL